MRRMVSSIIAACLALAAILQARADGAAVSQPAENLALGKPYSFNAPPRYSRCTDPDDIKQLTDGKLAPANPTGLWAEQATVGWSGVKPVAITVDLGRVEPISGVMYSTAAGQSGVHWPETIYILVSDDGRTYHVADELVASNLEQNPAPPQEYSTYQFRTQKLQTHGRYVSFVVSAQEYVFVDELEIYRGDDSWKGLPYTGRAIPDLKTFLTTGEKERTAQRYIVRRYRADLEALGAAVKSAALPAAAEQRLRDGLARLERQVAEYQYEYSPDFRNVLPIGEVGKRIFQLQAELWRASSVPAIAVWQSGAWDPLPVVHMAPGDATPRLSIVQMPNEYRSCAFNVSNSTPEAVRLGLRISGLPGGDNPSWVRVHFAEWTDTSGGVAVAAALPPAQKQGDQYVIEIPSGMTRQVWLNVRAPADTAPGTHEARVMLTGADNKLEVPLTVRVSPVRFPERPALHLGGWDYLTSSEGVMDVTTANVDTVLAFLKEYFVDSPWAYGNVLPAGKYDESGNMIAEPDTSAFARWRANWPDARQYCVFTEAGEEFAGSKIGEPLFGRKVAGWIGFWAKYLQQQGISSDRLVLLIVDEPSSAEHTRIIKAWSTAIHATGIPVKVWEDPHYPDLAKADQELLRGCDVLCAQHDPALPQSQLQHYLERRAQGTELGLYACTGAPAQATDPYSYYRFLAWKCWQLGAKAMYFWSFADAGRAFSWNEYAANRAFVPYFLDAATVTTAKQMEAIREGIEDHQYLVMLQEAVSRAEGRGQAGEAVKRGRRLLEEAAQYAQVFDRQIKTTQWIPGIDRSTADRLRLEILDSLEQLAP